MSYRLLSAFLLAVTVAFAGVSLISGQDKTKEGEKESDESKDEKEGDAAEEKDEDKPLTEEEFNDLMEEDLDKAWKSLKINARKKMGDKAAEAADEIAEHSPKILRYDGEVLDGKKKGEKARDQKDFKKWVEEMQEAAEGYAKEVRKGDWEDAEEHKDKINEACNGCHDKYEPIDEE